MRRVFGFGRCPTGTCTLAPTIVRAMRGHRRARRPRQQAGGRMLELHQHNRGFRALPIVSLDVGEGDSAIAVSISRPATPKRNTVRSGDCRPWAMPKGEHGVARADAGSQRAHRNAQGPSSSVVSSGRWRQGDGGHVRCSVLVRGGQSGVQTVSAGAAGNPTGTLVVPCR